MPHLFASPPLFAAFLAASLILAVTPGPGVLYIVTRSATQGRAAGLASVAGVAAGNLGNATAASLGLAALFAISTAAYVVVKYLGAAYLVYLGLRALRTTPESTALGEEPHRHRVGLRRIFTDGFVVALLNPKTALFFAAFLPQFLPNGAGTGQTLALGVMFVCIAAATDTGYACAAGAARACFGRAAFVQRAGRYVSGGVLVGLGLLTAISGESAKR